MSNPIKAHVRHIFGMLMVATLALAAASPALPAADETTNKVDKLFAAWDKTTSPGATLAVIKDGKIVYERGYGMAKLEDGIVNTPDKIFDIGSVSKQFTATCVAMLIREGKVGLDDDIRKYLPEMPAYEKPVTVSHLLHHTSGLRDYNALLEPGRLPGGRRTRPPSRRPSRSSGARRSSTTCRARNIPTRTAASSSSARSSSGSAGSRSTPSPRNGSSGRWA